MAPVLIAANWKMYKDIQQTKEYFEAWRSRSFSHRSGGPLPSGLPLDSPRPVSPPRRSATGCPTLPRRGRRGIHGRSLLCAFEQPGVPVRPDRALGEEAHIRRGGCAPVGEVQGFAQAWPEAHLLRGRDPGTARVGRYLGRDRIATFEGSWREASGRRFRSGLRTRVGHWDR